MSYCNSGDTPTVKYSFNGSDGIPFKSYVSPINVSAGTVTPVGTTSNYDPTGYRMVFNCDALGIFNDIVTDYYTSVQPNPDILAGGTITIMNVLLCGATTFIGTGKLLSTPTFDHAQHCSNVGNGGSCQITVTDNSGNQIFHASGSCPVTYSIQCGRCPDNTIECSCPNYPGYCCLDCGSIEGQLSQLINQVKSL